MSYIRHLDILRVNFYKNISANMSPCKGLVPLVFKSVLMYVILFSDSILKENCNMKEKRYKKEVQIDRVGLALGLG